ncbi:MAG: 50S ribosomal protein L17, large subunit ribosomal protein L17 [Candidatus Peregrinibacteria bacterium GW2011_GWC2_33_13]|nr:MAG: 50S ribosomal protein L17, large subunit ribosomal protein L17 [Candidatus Peregrinibacteria bacterium GW2011_GWC2_33_13]
MRHNKKRLKFNRDKGHKDAMLRNLATSIILYEKVKTTKTKAKAIAPVVDHLIQISKEENKMNAIRKINKIVLDKNASKKLMEELNKRYAEKNSGYTRVVDLGMRKGDAAPISQIELI